MVESGAREQFGEDRETFVARVRLALGRVDGQEPSESAPAVEDVLVRLASSEDDVVGLFCERAEAVGMRVRRIAADHLVDEVIGLVTELGVKRMAVSAGNVPQTSAMVEKLRRGNLELLDWRSERGFGGQWELDVAITDVHAAIAETGTLVCCSDSDTSRGLSLLPELHIAIVRADDIVPDMLDYWRRVEQMGSRRLPSSQVFITGPSKTSDIEGVLITGVHGPRDVHVIVVEDG